MRYILRQNSCIGALGTLGYSNLPMQDVQKIARSKLPRASYHCFSKVLIQMNLNGLCVAL